MAMELDVWRGNWGLPSVDYSSLQLIVSNFDCFIYKLWSNHFHDFEKTDDDPRTFNTQSTFKFFGSHLSRLWLNLPVVSTLLLTKSTILLEYYTIMSLFFDIPNEDCIASKMS